MKDQPAIPSLLFHSVRKEAGNDLFAIDPARFEDIIASIAQRFGAVTFPNLDDGKVLLTFDDGYRDNYELVVPILDKYHIKGLFFILPQYMGKQNMWNTRADVLLDHMTKQEVQALVAAGHTVGSHGLTHHKLTKFDDHQIQVELRESRRLLEDALEVHIDCFAYPYGSTNERVSHLAGQVYRYAFGTDTAPAHWNGSACTNIRREFVWPHSSPDDIEQLVVHFGTYDNNPYKQQ